MKFRLQHQNDLISRMLVLEYMRELDTVKLHDACNKHKQKKMFYRFYDEDDKEQIDVNWEYVLFEATMYELEALMEQFLEEIEEIDKKEKSKSEMLGEQKILVPKPSGVIEDGPSGLLDANGMPLKKD